ncbi:hypothetical protein SERLA73DRAFT_65582 [Serpula lacrymans var. lacrymans S7.3]|uniref:histone deacetylase n=2 Tax=Serpula lacrymans var. lacrymans TaxID=341189 RepID=F8QGJ9_SERL3|nr:uncharacterized protein SERLADRAFT_433295 [Serpula lacrymans var. lacrymans S7.9]EGN92545.1 hypothetical protein SERLA73DRAFT_65582 [Serpula lacrymans var. lacrymans S7.3]EGO29289.1 hypothetical protein SERLADRAFT_433295 [Serpula lacrymans var. lacrymans S7.9]
MATSKKTNNPNKRVVYVVSEELAKVSSLLPSNKNRSLLVHSLASSLGILVPKQKHNGQHIRLIRPNRATLKDLSVYHTRDYLDFSLNPDNHSENVQQEPNESADFGLEDDCPPFRGLDDYIFLVAGASLTGANTLKTDQADIAICWDGGRHHAQKARASGFCYVADCVLAILALRRFVPNPYDNISPAPPSKKPRIMYLDLDLHFSDSVSQAFYSTSSTNSPQVLTFSIHHAAEGFFPISPLSSLPAPGSPTFDPFSLSLPLRPGASNRTFMRIWPIVERVKNLFEPDYIVVQCGLDGLAGDPMATWNWSLEGEGSLGWCTSRVVHEWDGKKLLLGGGGYNSPNAARAWAYLTSIAMGKPLSVDTEIPDHRAFPLYGPSFTLDVPAGNMQDQNNEEYIKSVEECFEDVLFALQHRLRQSTT